MHVRIAFEQGGNQGALAAADIDELVETGKIIGLEDRRDLLFGEAAHRRMKQRRRSRMCRQMRIHRLAMRVLEGRLAGPDTVKHLAVGIPEHRVAVEQRRASE